MVSELWSPDKEWRDVSEVPLQCTVEDGLLVLRKPKDQYVATIGLRKGDLHTLYSAISDFLKQGLKEGIEDDF